MPRQHPVLQGVWEELESPFGSWETSLESGGMWVWTDVALFVSFPRFSQAMPKSRGPAGSRHTALPFPFPPYSPLAFISILRSSPLASSLALHRVTSLLSSLHSQSLPQHNSSSPSASRSLHDLYRTFNRQHCVYLYALCSKEVEGDKVQDLWTPTDIAHWYLWPPS